MGQTIKFADNGVGRSTTVGIADGVDAWIGIAEKSESIAQVGDILLETYDCSDAAYESMSSDRSWITLIDQRHKPALLQAIKNQTDNTKQGDDLILSFLSSQFRYLGDVNDWLLQNRIPYRKFCDGGYGLSEDKPHFQDAEKLAREAHRGQKDKAGADYIDHPLRLMNTFDYGGSYENYDYEQQRKQEELTGDSRIVAVLHDTLEDTWLTLPTDKSGGFSLQRELRDFSRLTFPPRAFYQRAACGSHLSVCPTAS